MRITLPGRFAQDGEAGKQVLAASLKRAIASTKVDRLWFLPGTRHHDGLVLTLRAVDCASSTGSPRASQPRQPAKRPAPPLRNSRRLPQECGCDRNQD